MGQTQELTPSRFHTSSYTALGNVSQNFTLKRPPKEFRIKRSSRDRQQHFEPFLTSESFNIKTTGDVDSKSAKKALQSKSEYVHQLADKSVAQILSNQRPSPGNMYFTNSRKSAKELDDDFGSKVTSRTIKHASKTFDEIISQDVHFGTLLHKIKKAYDTYIRRKCGELHSEDENPSYEELNTKIKSLEGALKEKNTMITKLEKEFVNMRNDIEKHYLEVGIVLS